jgi:hypothetical protein
MQCKLFLCDVVLATAEICSGSSHSIVPKGLTNLSQADLREHCLVIGKPGCERRHIHGESVTTMCKG